MICLNQTESCLSKKAHKEALFSLQLSLLYKTELYIIIQYKNFVVPVLEGH